MLEYSFIIYYLILNIVAFILYGQDKKRARERRWRIPERALLGIALSGGALGAWLGMRIFRHKTQHIRFQIFVPLCLVIHVIIIYKVFSLI